MLIFFHEKLFWQLGAMIHREKKRVSKMAELQAAQILLNWVKDAENGLAAYVQYYLDQNDEATLRKIKEVYDEIKALFGF
ncbi:MAG: hypothetical protein Kow0069_04750 [Promethearchaeota archaeon]